MHIGLDPSPKGLGGPPVSSQELRVLGVEIGVGLRPFGVGNLRVPVPQKQGQKRDALLGRGQVPTRGKLCGNGDGGAQGQVTEGLPPLQGQERMVGSEDQGTATSGPKPDHLPDAAFQDLQHRDPVEAVIGPKGEDLHPGLHRLYGDPLPRGGIQDQAPLRQAPAQKVRLPQGVPRHRRGDLHDLLLVDGDAIGLVQDGPQVLLGVGELGVARGLLAVVAPDVGGDVLHGPGAVEGDQGDDVLQAPGLQAPHRGRHPPGLQLEDPLGLPPGEELKGLGVVQGKAVVVQLHAFGLLDDPPGLVQEGEGAEAQEVHL